MINVVACGGSYSCMDNPSPPEDPGTGYYCGDTPTPVTTNTNGEMN